MKRMKLIKVWKWNKNGGWSGISQDKKYVGEEKENKMERFKCIKSKQQRTFLIKALGTLSRKLFLKIDKKWKT